MPPNHVHFNGGVNLADAESVMREIAARVPSGLRRIRDGMAESVIGLFKTELIKPREGPRACSLQPRRRVRSG